MVRHLHLHAEWYFSTKCCIHKKQESMSSTVSTSLPGDIKKAPRVVQWSPEMEDAFHVFISKLCNASELCIPMSSDKFTLYTDASGRGIGAVLSVEKDGIETPTAYYSRQLKGQR